MENKNIFNMDSIMNASFGEVSNKLTVTFKKTILVRDYETEVIEATTSVELDGKVRGIERMFISALLEAQMEYTVYCNLAVKGIATATQLAEKKKCLEEAVYAIKFKADSLLGAGVIDKYINDVNL
jgi:hypothetical protein